MAQVAGWCVIQKRIFLAAGAIGIACYAVPGTAENLTREVLFGSELASDPDMLR